MKSHNKVTLIGNLGKDLEIQHLENSITVAKFTLATNESFKSRNGEIKTETEWHNVVVWGKLAELANKYLQKGSYVFIEGKLKTRSYEDKDGIKRYVTEIIADELIMLEKSRNDNYL